MSHSPQSGCNMESCMHILDSHFENPFLSHLNATELWSLLSTSFCLRMNKTPCSDPSFTIMYFCFPVVVLPKINVVSTKGEGVHAFPPPLSHPCTFLTFFFKLQSATESDITAAIHKQLLKICISPDTGSMLGHLPLPWALSWHTARTPLLQCRLSVYSVWTFNAEIQHDAVSQIKQHLP